MESSLLDIVEKYMDLVPGYMWECAAMVLLTWAFHIAHSFLLLCVSRQLIDYSM